MNTAQAKFHVLLVIATHNSAHACTTHRRGGATIGLDIFTSLLSRQTLNNMAKDPNRIYHSADVPHQMDK